MNNINKENLIETLDKKKWNKNLRIGYKKIIESKSIPPNMVLRIINFEFIDIVEKNFYDSIIMGSHQRFPLETKYDMMEYKSYIKNDYMLRENSPSDFNDIFSSQINESDMLSKSEFYKLTNLPRIKKLWTIANVPLLIEVLMLHENRSITYISWDFYD